MHFKDVHMRKQQRNEISLHFEVSTIKAKKPQDIGQQSGYSNGKLNLLFLVAKYFGGILLCSAELKI
jgi:hypothetical protein